MTTPEVRKSEIKGFLRHQESLGGVKPSQLSDGTKILVETRDFVYQIMASDAVVGRRFFVDTASPNCRGDHVCSSISSHSMKLKYEMPDWIGKDMRMVLMFTSGRKIMTGEVQGVSITGTKDDGTPFTFELWSNTDAS